MRSLADQALYKAKRARQGLRSIQLFGEAEKKKRRLITNY